MLSSVGDNVVNKGLLLVDHTYHPEEEYEKERKMKHSLVVDSRLLLVSKRWQTSRRSRTVFV